MRRLLGAALVAVALALPSRPGDAALEDGACAGTLLEVRSNVPAEPVGERLPFAVVVGEREFIVGCHTFERFLDPRWETFYVFNDEFTRRWRLRELVDGVVASTSRGAHAVVFSELPCEYTARLRALDILEASGRPMPEVLLTANCDIQPLPPWHPNHLPFPAMAERMVADFLRDSAARRTAAGSRAELFSAPQMKRWGTRCLRRVLENFTDHAHAPLFFMSQLIVETLPSATSLEGAFLHGLDVGDWARRRADRGFRPSYLRPGEPWLVDASAWTEEHIVAYNATMLRGLRPLLAAIGQTVLESDRLLPNLMSERGWAAVRHNDLVTFYDLGIRSISSYDARTRERRPLFRPEAYPPAVDLDGFVMRYNMWLMARRASPQACFREQVGVAQTFAFAVPVWCGFGMMHMMPEHLGVPHVLPPGTTVRQLEPLLLPLFELLGWSELSRSAGAVELVQLPFFHSRNVSVSEGALHMRPPNSTLTLPHVRPMVLGDVRFLHARLERAGAPPRTLTYAASTLVCNTALELAQALPHRPPTIELPLDAIVERIALPFDPGFVGKLSSRTKGVDIGVRFCRSHQLVGRSLRALGPVPGGGADEAEGGGSRARRSRRLAEALAPYDGLCRRPLSTLDKARRQPSRPNLMRAAPASAAHAFRHQ